MYQGKITPNGVSLEKHENDTVVFFTELGYDIELVPPSTLSGNKKPDFIMGGVFWEVKSPQSNGAQIRFHSSKRTNIKRLVVITKDGVQIDIK